MKNQHLFIGLLFFAFSFVLTMQVYGQPKVTDTTNGLTVSAVAILMTNDSPKLHVIVQLLNTTDHEITVLTKAKASRYYNMSSDKTKFWFWIQFNEDFTWHGHKVVPSLSEFAPVTLKPSEVALSFIDVEQSATLKTLNGLTNNSPIVISYEVSPDLGKRFDCWSGRIETKPFHLGF